MERCVYSWVCVKYFEWIGPGKTVFDEVIFEQGSEWSDMSHADIWCQSVPGRVNTVVSSRPLFCGQSRQTPLCSQSQAGAVTPPSLCMSYSIYLECLLFPVSLPDLFYTIISPHLWKYLKWFTFSTVYQA